MMIRQIHTHSQHGNSITGTGTIAEGSKTLHSDSALSLTAVKEEFYLSPHFAIFARLLRLSTGEVKVTGEIRIVYHRAPHPKVTGNFLTFSYPALTLGCRKRPTRLSTISQTTRHVGKFLPRSRHLYAMY